MEAQRTREGEERGGKFEKPTRQESGALFGSKQVKQGKGEVPSLS